MAHQSALHDEIGEMWELYKKCLPEIGAAYDALPSEVYKEGALSG